MVRCPINPEGEMTRHPAARRRHQEKDSDDIVAEKLLQFFVWAKKNARALGIGAAVVIVAVLATIYSVNMREARRAESLVRLNEVRETALSGNTVLAIRDLEVFLTEFSGTEAAKEARIILAQLSLEEGEHTQALEALEPLVGKLDSPLGPSAAILKGVALQEAGESERALETLLQVADRAPHSYQRREALERAAQISEEIGDRAGAIGLYERLVESTSEGSTERAIAEMRLAEVRAKASSEG